MGIQRKLARHFEERVKRWTASKRENWNTSNLMQIVWQQIKKPYLQIKMRKQRVLLCRMQNEGRNLIWIDSTVRRFHLIFVNCRCFMSSFVRKGRPSVPFFFFAISFSIRDEKEIGTKLEIKDWCIVIYLVWLEKGWIGIRNAISLSAIWKRVKW